MEWGPIVVTDKTRWREGRGHGRSKVGGRESERVSEGERGEWKWRRVRGGGVE